MRDRAHREAGRRRDPRLLHLLCLIREVWRAGGDEMPRVTWILKDDKKITADVPAGHNLMEAAVANNVPNVIGECGGCLSCATCHVYVDADWYLKSGTVSDL